MNIRSVVLSAVLSIAGLACSAGDHTGPSPVEMCSYPGLGNLKASDPLCVAPKPPKPTISVTPAEISAIAADTVTITMSTSNATACTPEVTGNAHLLDQNGCVSFRIVLDAVGTATVSATASGPGGTTTADTRQISVMPKPSTKDTVSVELWSPEVTDSPPEGEKAKFFWWNGSAKDSSEVSVINRIASVEVPIGRDSVEVHLYGDPRYSTDRKVVLYHGDFYHITQKVILESVSWKIHGGAYSGQVLPVSMKLCRAPAGTIDPGSFCILFPVKKSTGGEYKVFGRWAESSFPIKVGIVWAKSVNFDRVKDSTHIFNDILPVLSQTLGKEFVPTTINTETIPQGTIGIILGDNSWDNPGNALGGASGDMTTGEIQYGTVTLPSRIYLESGQESVIIHEMIHALGFGHTCGWITIMYSSQEENGGACTGKFASVPTPMDVAMFEMTNAIRDAAKAHSTVFAINN